MNVINSSDPYKSLPNITEFSLTDKQIKDLFFKLDEKATAKIVHEECFRVSSRPGPHIIGYTNVTCPIRTHVGEKGGDALPPLPANRVHANHIAFNLGENVVQVVCAQAPQVENEAEFWITALETKALAIFDLTHEGDTNFRCYYPVDKDEHYVTKIGLKEVHPHTIHTEAAIQFLKSEGHLIEKCTYRVDGIVATKNDEELVHKENTEGEIARYHYKSWPDHGAPSLEDFSQLIETLHQVSNTAPERPVWIHCRGGVGRSGTAAVGLAIRQAFELDAAPKDRSEMVKWINGLILQARQQRSLMMVQTKDQYGLLIRYTEQLMK